MYEYRALVVTIPSYDTFRREIINELPYSVIRLSDGTYLIHTGDPQSNEHIYIADIERYRRRFILLQRRLSTYKLVIGYSAKLAVIGMGKLLKDDDYRAMAGLMRWIDERVDTSPYKMNLQSLYNVLEKGPERGSTIIQGVSVDDILVYSDKVCLRSCDELEITRSEIHAENLLDLIGVIGLIVRYCDLL